jgi:peptidoglycan/xylan/chitin deacetylase (PgdA/CDA1 family)
MKPYFIKTPSLIPALYSNQIWSFSSEKKELFLTFDDGPTPEITDWALDILKDFNAKATFFCIGKNVEEHPEIFNRIILERHSVGNHTHNHVKGWKTTAKDYLENTQKAQEVLNHLSKKNELKLFRPPYGKIKTSQTKQLIQLGYTIVMWSVLSADFDQHISEEQCYSNVIKNASSGSIIVFHDSVKASKNLKTTLPKVLEYFSKKGYTFKKIEATDIAALN